MSEINILSPFVADLIAAGEVVDRPASVVKELMENAFDAGAHTVTVELRRGGTTYIRVTDDGKGMAPEDAGVAFLRHATSKLNDERGLESIGTFGFRGEALAAVSAVSRIEMTTRQTGAETGVRMTLTAGDIQEMYETGCPEGTTMIIRDLFFNTPARLKFLKTDRAEGTACVQAAMKCALGRPDISVRCIKDGKEEFFSPGDGKIQSCVYHLLGRDMAKNMIECLPIADDIRVSGFISSPAEGRGNRTSQYFFVNGRAIKSPMLQKGLELAYRNRLLTGRYPYCVLYVDIPYGSVDVNVHPAKAEVKFSNEKAIFDAVYYTCLEAVGKEDRLHEEPSTKTTGMVQSPVPAPAAKPAPAPARPEFPRPANPVTPAYTNRPPMPEAPAVPAAPAAPAPAEPDKVRYDESGRLIPSDDGHELERYDIPLKLKKSYMLHDVTANMEPAEQFMPDQLPADVEQVDTTPAELPPVQEPVTQGDLALTMEPIVPEEPAEEPVQQTVWADEPTEGPVCEPFRVVGEVLTTYIVVEHGDKMTLIDKHAAHERINFDRLSSYHTDAPSQMLLVPELLKLSRQDQDMVWENLSTFQSLGYEIEEFGDGALMLRAVPAGIDPSEGRAAIEELCETISGGRKVTYDQLRQELLKTVACKAAIKAGKSSAPQELETLARAVLSGQVKYCPHGRPVSVTFTHYQLDKQFDRIV